MGQRTRKRQPSGEDIPGRMRELKGAVGLSLHGVAMRPDCTVNASGLSSLEVGLKGILKMSLGTILLLHPQSSLRYVG